MSDLTEHDPLSGYDLHAWKVPPPTAGLADGVLRRMQGTPPVARPRRQWRTVLATAGATVVAGVAAIVIATSIAGGGGSSTASDEPTPKSSVVASAPAGSVADAQGEARLRGLEARMERLERDLAVLRAQAQRSDPPPVTVPPVPTPRPPVVSPPPPPSAQAEGSADIDGTLDPYGSEHSVDPFASRTGIARPADELEDPFGQARPIADTGELEVHSTPSAALSVDGRDLHQTTPAVLALPVGKHKVTLVVGGDRYSYHVKIAAHQRTQLDKSL